MKNNKSKSVFPEEPILPRGGVKVHAYLQILSKWYELHYPLTNEVFVRKLIEYNNLFFIK